MSMLVNSFAVATAAPAALSLNFATATYSVGGTPYTPLSSVPGYVFTRSGAVSIYDSSNAVASFATDVPAINDYGFHAYESLTNKSIQSQVFGTSWGPRSGATVTSNTTVAPDGTTTADTVTMTASSNDGIYISPALDSSPTNSVWAKTASGTKTFRLMVYWGGAGADTSSDFTATTTWQRFVFISTQQSEQLNILNGSSGAAGDVIVWQAQQLNASLTDGGPMIVTTTAAATVGASSLAVSLGNGTYSALYTFDDSSTQTIGSTVISGGTYTVPTYPTTLNRPKVKSVVLT